MLFLLLLLLRLIQMMDVLLVATQAPRAVERAQSPPPEMHSGSVVSMDDTMSTPPAAFTLTPPRSALKKRVCVWLFLVSL